MQTETGKKYKKKRAQTRKDACIKMLKDIPGRFKRAAK